MFVVSPNTQKTMSDLKILSKKNMATFYYFAYGSCMCPVDLKRSLGENTHDYVVGPATLKGYRLGFYCYCEKRDCGVLDVVEDPNSSVEGVLYQLPWQQSINLDRRECVHEGRYKHEMIEVVCQGQLYKTVRTYVVIDKLSEEVAPGDWYFNVVLRGAVTSGLPEQYCWKLFNHMHQLQQQQLGSRRWQAA
jgi:cation transport regulator ChaC